MGKILAFQITEVQRVRLCMSVGVVNWICILLSLVLLGIGAYVKITVAEFMHLIENYDADTFPYLLIGVGLFSFLLNGGAGFLFFMSNNPKKREMLRPFYFVYLALSGLVAVTILAGGVLCFSHIGHLEESFESGLTASMEMYRSAAHVKKEIDELQMNFKCCGSDYYEDWFPVDWVSKDYRADFEDQWDRSPLHDHVPFSCCSVEVPRPCIHTDVHDNYAHVNYDYRTSLTLNQAGCREALMNYFGDDILVPSGCLILIIFFLQLCLIVLSRFLQTSITSALAKGSPTIQSEAYLLQFGSDGPPNRMDQDQPLIQPDTYPMDQQESDGDPGDLGDWDDLSNDPLAEPGRRVSRRSNVRSKTGGLEDTSLERKRSSGRNTSVRARLSSHSLHKPPVTKPPEPPLQPVPVLPKQPGAQ